MLSCCFFFFLLPLDSTRVEISRCRTIEPRCYRNIPSESKEHSPTLRTSSGVCHFRSDTTPLNPVNRLLHLRGGTDEDSDEQNLIGDLVLDDIEGRTLEQEIEALERELEEAYDSRAVAEKVSGEFFSRFTPKLIKCACQVNGQLKAAIEFQSLEIARLRASTGNLTSSIALTDGRVGANFNTQQTDEVSRLRDMLQSREREILLLTEEKERLEREEQRNRRELRRTKLAHARATHELDKAMSSLLPPLVVLYPQLLLLVTNDTILVFLFCSYDPQAAKECSSCGDARKSSPA